jgi:hypothetical protein
MEKLLNEKLHKLNPLPNIITVVVSRRIRWAENMALIEETCIQIFGRRTSKEPNR